MKLEHRLDKYYKEKWAAERWQEVPGYAQGALEKLSCVYRKKGGWGPAIEKGLRWENYSTTVIKPWIGPNYDIDGSAFKTVILLRDYPLPTLLKEGAKGDDRLPESRGEHAIGPDIMQQEIRTLQEALTRRQKSRYTTLWNACRRAHDVERQVRRKPMVEFDAKCIDAIVVTDLVKLFAIFQHESHEGVPFHGDKLSRSSVHSKDMYRYALRQLKGELDLLQPSLVVSFVGNSGWRCADGPDDRGCLDNILKEYNVALCAHPGAPRKAGIREAWCCTPGWRSEEHRKMCQPRLVCPRCDE